MNDFLLWFHWRNNRLWNKYDEDIFSRNLENETKRTKKLVKGLELQLSVVEGQMLVEEMNEANHNLGSSFSLGSNNAVSKGFKGKTEEKYMLFNL